MNGINEIHRKFLQVLKYRREHRGFNEIASVTGLEANDVENWIKGRPPEGIHPNQAEQWRQAILFSFNKPLEAYREKWI